MVKDTVIEYLAVKDKNPLNAILLHLKCNKLFIDHVLYVTGGDDGSAQDMDEVTNVIIVTLD